MVFSGKLLRYFSTISANDDTAILPSLPAY